MSDAVADPLAELPADMRKTVARMATLKAIPVDWLVWLYRRGYNAKMGATGEYPYGKAGPSDEGELAMALAADHRQGMVRLEFGKPVAWLGLPAAHARHLAKMLVDKADELDREALMSYDERYEVRNAEIERTLRTLAMLIDGGVPEGWAWGLFIVPFGEHEAAPKGEGAVFWISNGDRAGMVDAVKGWVENQELKERAKRAT